MKIYLNNKSNKSQISSIRSQIKDAGDLKVFDEFLSKHDSIDFGSQNDVDAARACCGCGPPDRPCCSSGPYPIVIPPITTN